MQFVDTCTIELRAGNGGNGIVAWRKEAHYPQGGPWGGDGGKGGDIIIFGDNNLNSLFHLRYLKKVAAKNGENGQSKCCSGRSSEDVYVKVPLGTSIYDANTNELIVDIVDDKQEFIICHGGNGGFGNAKFKSSFNHAPTLYENGDLGEAKKVILKLRYIADVGIIGKPNAGKSTLIRAISNAKPKVANFEFTTLTPVLGNIKIKDHNLVFADIPGLIKGASEGRGLGFDFLKHIERCRNIIILLSLNEEENGDIVENYHILLDELTKYDPNLVQKSLTIAANKSDCEGAEQVYEKLKKALPNQKIFKISALNNKNVSELIHYIDEEITAQRAKEALAKAEEKVPEITFDLEKTIKKELIINKVDDHTYEVVSDWMAYWSHKIPLTTKDNIIRYNQKMQSLGVEAKAKAMGAIKGDTLLIYGNEMVIDD